MNVVLCSKCTKPLSKCIMHSHECWEIVLNYYGETVSVIGGREYEISEGDVMIIPPGTEHDGNSRTEYADMYVQAKNMDFTEPFVIHDADGSVLTLMNMIHKVMLEKEVNYSHIADSLFEAVCQYIKKMTDMNYKYSFVNDMKNLIYENLSNPDFDIAEQIIKSGFNEDYFRRCFKKDIKKTPLQYMTDLRIERAKVMLLENSFVSVENVALNCGFADALYFSNCFKKHMGMSPMQYRKANNNLFMN